MFIFQKVLLSENTYRILSHTCIYNEFLYQYIHMINVMDILNSGTSSKHWVYMKCTVLSGTCIYVYAMDKYMYMP